MFFPQTVAGEVVGEVLRLVEQVVVVVEEFIGQLLEREVSSMIHSG